MYAHHNICRAAPLYPPCCAARMQLVGGLVVSEQRSFDAGEDKNKNIYCGGVQDVTGSSSEYFACQIPNAFTDSQFCWEKIGMHA